MFHQRSTRMHTRITPAQRLQGIEPSIFAVMSALAAKHNAVNLGQGFPDFDGPPWLVEQFAGALHAGRNQYAPMPGTQSLREAVAAYQRDMHAVSWDADTEITITAGATEALCCAFLAFLDPGDEVLLFEPFYDAYLADALLAGARPRCVTLHAPDFRIDEEELRRAVTPRTRMIVLNNPHNPTGRVFSAGELRLVAEVAEEHNLLVLSDEVYEFLTYDDARHIAFASLPGMRERCIAISSTGKTFGMTGWKIGYAMATAPLTQALRTVHQFATFAVNTPAQLAMGRALGRLAEYLPEFRATYQSKRALLAQGLADTPFTAILPEGSYFMMVRLPREGKRTDVEIARYLVEHHRVAVIPPSVFYTESDEGMTMLRLCFAKKDDTLRAGIECLRAASVAL